MNVKRSEGSPEAESAVIAEHGPGMDHGDSGRGSLGNNPVSGIADKGRPGIGNKRHVLAFLKNREQQRNLPAFIHVMKGNQAATGPVDLQGLQEHPRVPRVLAGENRNLAKDRKRPQCDVLKITYRGGHDVEGSGHSSQISLGV